MDLSWELMAAWQGAPVTVPALYVDGERDGSVRLPGVDQLIANMSSVVPNLRKTVRLPETGHWAPEERADEVNAALLAFLAEL